MKTAPNAFFFSCLEIILDFEMIAEAKRKICWARKSFNKKKIEIIVELRKFLLIYLNLNQTIRPNCTFIL